MRTKAWWPVSAVLVGLYLVSKPQCIGGCRAVARRLLTYGIYGLFG